MSSTPGPVRRTALIIAAAILAGISAFFIFYTARLLYVTHGLQVIRPGGQGAYLGAVAFPLLAVLAGWGAWRCGKSSQAAA